MELNKLIEKIEKELKEEIKKDKSLLFIRQAESYESLLSVLRDRVFHDDRKVNTFIEKITSTDDTGASKPTKSELSESELTELIFKSLEKSFKDKTSKFKLDSYYFSVEKDLVINISDKNDFKSTYRIITVKTT